MQAWAERRKRPSDHFLLQCMSTILADALSLTGGKVLQVHAETWLRERPGPRDVEDLEQTAVRETIRLPATTPHRVNRCVPVFFLESSSVSIYCSMNHGHDSFQNTLLARKGSTTCASRWMTLNAVHAVDTHALLGEVAASRRLASITFLVVLVMLGIGGRVLGCPRRRSREIERC